MHDFTPEWIMIDHENRSSATWSKNHQFWENLFKNGSKRPKNTAKRRRVLGSLVVSIPACHAGDRGSIPRRGEHIFASQASLVLLISMQKHPLVELGCAISC